MSKDCFFKLWREYFFGRKKSFAKISDFKTVMNLYKLEIPVSLKFNRIKRLVFILRFLFAKPTSKSYKFFYKTFQTSKFLHKKYVGFFIVIKILTETACYFKCNVKCNYKQLGVV